MRTTTNNGRTYEVHDCEKHGEYLVRADKKNLTRDCRKCGKVHDTASFIAKAKSVHGDEFDYSSVDYRNTLTPVLVVCKKHGPFPQKPNGHLSGRGCSKCSGKFRHTTETFTEKAASIHDGFYDYSLVNYTKSDVEVDIICPEHGTFSQMPSSHLAGKGCRKCGYGNIDKSVWRSNGGWSVSDWRNQAENSKRFDSFKLYILECQGNGERFCKVGRTFLPINKRFFQSNIPYSYTPLLVLDYGSNADMAYQSEAMIKKYVQPFSYRPKIDFSGATECFIPGGVDMDVALWAEPQHRLLP